MSEKDIKPLIEKAKKFINSAKVLFNIGDFDSTVSRTYYAMHHIVEAVLFTKNLKIKTHRGLISTFGQFFVKTNIFPKEIGRQLRDTFDKRLIGDYEYAIEINKEDAEKVLKTGEEFIDKLIEYLEKKNFI